MELFSLHICEFPTDRHVERKIWLCIAISAIALLLIGADAELFGLWLGFAVGLCFRGRATAGANAIRNAWQQACAYAQQVVDRAWRVQLFDQATAVMVWLITWRRVFMAIRALAIYQPNFGLPPATSPPDR